MNRLLEAFDQHVVDRGDREALWSRGESLRWSFRRLAECSTDWERLLRPHAGRPVALATGNGSAFLGALLALWRLGCPVVVMDDGVAEAFERCRRLGIGLLIHRGTSGQRLADGICLDQPLDDDAAEPIPGTVLVKLTSGSTGQPVGWCFDDNSLWAGIGQIAEGMGLTTADRVLMALPLSHSYGFDSGILSLLVRGTPLVLEPSVFPGAMGRALVEGRVSVLPLVPPLVRSLGGVRWPQPTEDLRLVVCAGGRLDPGVAAAFHGASGLGVHNFYGSTETGGITFERQPFDDGAPGTVGRPLPGVEVSLDLEGRVCVDSAANRLGRWGDRPLDDRRVRTGDTAQWGNDGRLRLTGRTADLLQLGGRKVPAVHLETALATVDGVRRAAVVGVPDPVRGERAVAFLVTDHWPVDLSSVPADLTPREVRRLDALPHTGRGKLDRASLRRLATGPRTC